MSARLSAWARSRSSRSRSQRRRARGPPAPSAASECGSATRPSVRAPAITRWRSRRTTRSRARARPAAVLELGPGRRCPRRARRGAVGRAPRPRAGPAIARSRARSIGCARAPIWTAPRSRPPARRRRPRSRGARLDLVACALLALSLLFHALWKRHRPVRQLLTATWTTLALGACAALVVFAGSLERPTEWSSAVARRCSTPRHPPPSPWALREGEVCRSSSAAAATSASRTRPVCAAGRSPRTFAGSPRATSSRTSSGTGQ